MTYSIDVITADASKLKNRALAYAFTSSPYMITAFAGSKASDDFYYNISWRWGFGCFAIILPFVAAPLFVVLKLNLEKAQKRGLLIRERSGRTLLQNIWYYTLEFDGMDFFLAVEIQLLTSRKHLVLCCLLVASQYSSYRLPSLIALLTAGHPDISLL